MSLTKSLVVYLAGNIQKNHEKESQIFWSPQDLIELEEAFKPHELIFLNPAIRTDDLSDQKSVFGRDMTQVFFADAILVDARERRGLGVGAEMMWAKVNQIPVLTLAPKNSHYQKDKMSLLGVNVKGWVHPFVESLSDIILQDLKEAAPYFEKLVEGKLKVKNTPFIFDTMHYYQNTQLSQDLPMRDLIEKSERLKEKLKSFKSSESLLKQQLEPNFER